MIVGKISHDLLKKLGKGMFVFLVYWFTLLMIVSIPQAGEVKGKITSIRGNAMELDLGTEKGVQLGDSGRVYYNILIDGKEKPIFIARFKITHLSEKSSAAQVEEKTGEVKVGYLVEIVVKEGELELRSDPSRAKVYVDGKEKGETPSVVSNVRLGGHVIRIVKEGYEPYEEQVRVVEGERKKVSVSLKRLVGTLVVSTDPPGASIFIDGRSVGVSPYEGRDLSSGAHRVRVVKEGYDILEKDVMVEAGRRAEVFTMLREKTKVVTLPSPPPKAEPPKVAEPRVAEVPKALREVDWAKKSCEAPIWKLGDKWTYKTVKGVTYSYEVVESKEDFFLLKEGIRDLRAYDKKTMNLLFLIGKDGRKIKDTENPFKKVLNFPIFVGKEWIDNIHPQIGVTYIVNLKVEGMEEIISKAGRFETYKIFFKETSMASFNSGWIRYWYSPEVKMWVKGEVEKTPFWANLPWLQSFELISYKLK